MGAPSLFIPITKVDLERREVWGIAAEERTDKTGREKFDYAKSAPYFTAWSSDFQKRTTAAGQEPSLGNVRYMHQPDAVGKLVALELDDAEKLVRAGAKVVDDACWEKVRAGVLTGFSIGGDYVDRWEDPDERGVKRYSARPSEISLVDNPCMYGATFEVVRADGATELRKFQAVAPATPRTDAVRAAKAALVEAASAGAVAKSLCYVSALADLLDRLACLTSALEMNEAVSGEDTTASLDLRAATAALAEALVTLVTDCTAELREGNDLLAEAAVQMAALPTALTKMSPVDARKIMRRVQKLHDYAVEIGAACAPTAEKTTTATIPAAPDQEDDDMDLETLQKALAANNDQLNKAIDTSIAKAVEPLTKTITEQGEQLAALAKTVEATDAKLDEQAERLAVVEATPAPAKGVVKAVAAPDRGAPVDDEFSDEKLAKLSPADRQLALIKKARRSGGFTLGPQDAPQAIGWR